MEDFFSDIFSTFGENIKRSLLHIHENDNIDSIDLNETDSEGKNVLIHALENHLKNNYISLQSIENLIFKSDLLHKDMPGYIDDTLMAYLKNPGLNFSKETVSHLIYNSDLKRLNPNCENSLLLALEHKKNLPLFYFDYLIEHSNIFVKTILNKFALKEIFNLHLSNPNFDVSLNSWVKLLKTKEMMDSLKTQNDIEKFENIVFKADYHEKYYQFKNYLTKELIKKTDCGKITKIKI